MNILDIILSIVLIFFSFIGFKKGLIKITLFFLACISGWILAGIFEPSLSKFFPEMSLNQNIISGTRGQNTPLRFIYSDAYNEANMLDAVNTGLSPAENDQWSQMWLLQ